MATPTLILGANNWAIEEDNILGYALGSSSKQYLPREISFTRGSDATYTDSTGVIRQACWNLLQRSEEFENSYWIKLGSTITNNAIIAPDGTLTADKLVANTVNTAHFLYYGYPAQAQTYTFSVYAKKGEDDYLIMRLDNDITSIRTWFNLSTGTIGTSQGGSPTITSVGSGWYRCSMSYTPSTALTIYPVVFDAKTDNVQNHLGNGVDGIYIWGAQLVQGSDPLPYLRTTDRLNVPRIDSSTGSKAFLVEPQRTNLLLNTVFDGTGSTPTSWSRPGGTGSSLLTTSTLGSGVQACSQSATAQRPFLQQDYTVAINTTYTFSMYIESISGTINFNNVMYLTNLPAGATTAYYLNNNLVDEGSQAQVGRLSIRVTIGATSSLVAVRCGIGTISNSTATILFSRPQFEVGSYQTTYIPTQATTVTRIADRSTMSSVSGLIGQSEGTIFADVEYVRDSTFTPRKPISINSGSSANLVDIYVNAGDNTLTARVRANSVGYGTISITNNPTGRIKIAYAYKANDYVLYINGSSYGTVTTGGPFVFSSPLNIFQAGCGESSNDELGGRIFQSAIYTTRLTNAELAALTTL